MSTTQTRRNALRLFAGPPMLAILPMMMAPSDAHLFGGGSGDHASERAGESHLCREGRALWG
jgi:hypothetical protein